MVDILHQQRPLFLGQPGKITSKKRAVFDLPFIILSALLGDEARLCIVPAGKGDEIVASQQTFKTGDGATYQQRLLLPVIAEETFGSET